MRGENLFYPAARSATFLILQFLKYMQRRKRRIKVLLEITADGKSAGVAVSFISSSAVNKPFVFSKPVESIGSSSGFDPEQWYVKVY